MEEVNNIPVTSPKQEKNEWQDKIDAARQITMLFKMERYVYVTCCGFAVLLLFFCAFQLLTTEPPNYPVVVSSLFGSGGLITYSIGRLIFMWNKIVDIVLMEGISKGGRDDGDK